MSIIQAIILGIVQGLSEFIPISSTAHLTLIGQWMGLINPEHPEQWTAFLAVIQLGTLAAVLIFFIKDIREILISFFKENISKNRNGIKEQSNSAKLGWYIIFGTLPIIIFGFLLKKIIEGNITKSPLVIACSLIGLAILLAIAERVANLKKEITGITFKDALLIGIAQCLALIPGASRSGTTITAGLFLGLKRETAAKFSFLLSIPAVMLSGIYEFYKSLAYLSMDNFLVLLIATLASAISGYAAIKFLLHFLQTRTTMLFVYYRLALGIIIIFLFL